MLKVIQFLIQNLLTSVDYEYSKSHYYLCLYRMRKEALIAQTLGRVTAG